jgi:hypothetical protein
MAWLWKALPIGRAAAAAWAWRNRRELGRWLGFAWRAVPPSTSDRDDLLAEGRLRVALAKDPRTRGAPSLSVRVVGGTAHLEGRVSQDVHDLTVAVTHQTKGVDRIDCRIGDRRRRHAPTPHSHTIPPNPTPRMPR